MSELILEPTKRTGPSIKRGKSEQEVGTPRVFLDAVEERFGALDWDLAANASNRVNGADGLGREDYFGPDHPRPEYRDALAIEWDIAGNLWCNPPFSNIAPWAAKCAAARLRLGWTFLLVPASVGSNWYAELVHGKAYVMFLLQRLTFVGSSDPYPRDLLLAAYGYGVQGSETWRWK